MRPRLPVSLPRTVSSLRILSQETPFSDSKVDEKLDAADKEALKAEIDKTVACWMRGQQATKEEYEEHQKNSRELRILS